MKRIICIATIRNEQTLNDVISILNKYKLDYEMVTPFRIKVDYNGFDHALFNRLSDLFESLESHSIHYFY